MRINGYTEFIIKGTVIFIIYKSHIKFTYRTCTFFSRETVVRYLSV